MIITSNTSLQDLLNESINTLSDLQSGEIFTVKQLFRGFEWERISKGNRTKLGSQFSNYAINAGSSIIQQLKKTSQNEQQYKKL